MVHNINTVITVLPHKLIVALSTLLCHITLHTQQSFFSQTFFECLLCVSGIILGCAHNYEQNKVLIF